MDPELLKLKLLIFAVWLFLIGINARKLILSLTSKNWNTTNARIISSDIIVKSGGNGLRFHHPNIVYEYTVGYETFKNDVFTFMGTYALTKRNADRNISDNNPGKIVDIYYNPKKPSQSVIMPGVHWLDVASLIFLTAILFGIAHIIEILNFVWPGCQPNCR